METSDDQPESSPAEKRKEQIFGFWLFLSVALLFVILFIFWHASQYRWLLLAMAFAAIVRAVRHRIYAGRFK